MKKVLVVEDNEWVGKLVAYHLGKLGCDVEACHSPLGVLQMVKEFRPDIVLRDMKMPGINDRNAAGLLRREELGITCKTIIFPPDKGHMQKQIIEEGLAGGYFVNSSSFETLKETMGRVFGLY